MKIQVPREISRKKIYFIIRTNLICDSKRSLSYRVRNEWTNIAINYLARTGLVICQKSELVHAPVILI